ncbi:adenylate kinase 1 ATP binding protein [Lindgomyces ingoldianus]|uniref:Adenylate kinase 1 ATP binding protein n=1 Tax=Lindgomyces ingoldianus TaxID=673940 RepID=A0ACB6QQL5_9PLEO|nr:adenylate kinase 1 ATP binding protein [Lindgomyces ingoldianus]KAF2468395.1 adenylate kinase 1 ATP binding protein [Lindgomyces ingoldianus]
MESTTPTLGKGSRCFAIIFVLGTSPLDRPIYSVFSNQILGAPGAGKGTLCAHLAQIHNLTHYSVGDNLRSWMHKNRGTSLAAQIQDKLDNQGFLSSEDLNPFLCQAIMEAIYQDEPKPKGILVDGFPRCLEQLESFSVWPFEDKLPLCPISDSEVRPNAKPDIVLSLEVTKQNARARYISRARDSNDSKEKFERRFVEYEAETIAVKDVYHQRGILINVDTNGSKEENIDKLTRKLDKSGLWQKVIVEGSTGVHILTKA